MAFPKVDRLEAAIRVSGGEVSPKSGLPSQVCVARSLRKAKEWFRRSPKREPDNTSRVTRFLAASDVQGAKECASAIESCTTGKACGSVCEVHRPRSGEHHTRRTQDSRSRSRHFVQECIGEKVQELELWRAEAPALLLPSRSPIRRGTRTFQWPTASKKSDRRSRWRNE